MNDNKRRSILTKLLPGITSLQGTDMFRVNPNGADSDQMVTAAQIAAYSAAVGGGLPSQTGNNGKVLSTDGTTASWMDLPGGGGTQTLNQTLVLGNTTGGEDISISNGDKIVLDNGSELRVGTYDFGGTGGISRICSVGYEDMWQSGIHHIFDNNGFIRESTNCFNYVPDISFDNTLRFKVGSRWVLDDGTTYMCTDASTGAAIWVDVSRVPSTGGTPYKLLQYDAAGDIQEVDNFTDGSGVVSIKIDARALNDSNADIIASWSSPDTFEIGATHLNLGLIQNFASNALAVAGGLNIGDVYRTAGVLMIVI